MKKNITKGLTAIAMAFTFASCTTTMPLTATNNPIGSKEGTSTNKCFFAAPVVSAGPGQVTSYGLCTSNKKYGIQQAAADAGISKVGTVDLKTQNLFIMTKFTLIVTGE